MDCGCFNAEWGCDLEEKWRTESVEGQDGEPEGFERRGLECRTLL